MREAVAGSRWLRKTKTITAARCFYRTWLTAAAPQQVWDGRRSMASTAEAGAAIERSWALPAERGLGAAGDVVMIISV